MNPSSPQRCFALVPCAGIGQRAGAMVPKQYVQLAGRSLVAHTLLALAQVPRLSATLVVLSPDDQLFVAPPELPAERAPWVAHCGGATRAKTVARGLEVLLERGAVPADWVLVHDAARCLLRPEWVDQLIDACQHDPVGGLLALPLADTLKQAQPAAAATQARAMPPRVAATVPRDGKWQAQTPQMFRLGLLRQALAQAGPEVTDEASAIEALGHAPRLVAGPMENFKLTYPSDFELADRLLRTRP